MRRKVELFLKSLTLGLEDVYLITRFTSDLPGDSFNGRIDVTQQGSAELEYRWTDRVAAFDFRRTIALLGLRYRLQ